MKLISWRRYEPGYLNLYDLTVEIHFKVRTLENEPEKFDTVTEIYRGDITWHNRATGHEASPVHDKELCALRRRIEWGDFRELDITPGTAGKL
jgi:hypothetical protein